MADPVRIQVLFSGTSLTVRTKVGIAQQNYNVMDQAYNNYSFVVFFLLRHRVLVTRLLSQGYKVNRLSNTFKKFYVRHTDLVGQYRKDVCQVFADSIS